MDNNIFDKKVKEATNFFDNDFSASTNVSILEFKNAINNMNPDILLNLLHVSFYSGYRYGKGIPRSIEEILEEVNTDYDLLAIHLGIDRSELDRKIKEESFTDSELDSICSYVGIEDKEKTFGRK